MAVQVDDQEQTKASMFFNMPGGWITMGCVNLTKLINLKLPADGYRLALLIANKSVHQSGLCYCPNEELAEEIGINKDRVSKLIGRLCEAKLIYRVGPRSVLVNPLWCFRGLSVDHRKAIELWQSYHPIGMVRRQAEQQARAS